MRKLHDVLTNREENYIFPFFWQHGEDEQTLREYMRVINEANIGAVCVESRPHPDFAGEKWWTDMDIILDEAQKRNMKVWILDDTHFPTGFANGAIAHAPKNLHHKYLCGHTLEMSGPVRGAEFTVKEYMCPPLLAPWMAMQKPETDDDFSDDRLIKILACPLLDGEKLGEPIDLTQFVQPDGRVVFDLPEGYFKIYVVYVTRNGSGRNDYINFMDPKSCRLQIDAVYEPHYAHYKSYFGNVIAGFFSDEPPVGNVKDYTPIGPIGTPVQDLPWSDLAEDGFTEAFGSADWVRFTPYLWAPAANENAQAKVRDAYMQMVTKLVSTCFSEQLGHWCAEHGVEYIGHMLEDCDMNMNLGASMGHFFRGLSGQHMAGIDNIGGQVLIGGQNTPRHNTPSCKDEAGFYHYVIGKLGATHAAIDPKKQGRTMCENFGAYGWQSGPREQKYLLDHFMVRGVNRFVPHAFTPAPFPDMDCPPHFYAHGENPTYRAFGEMMGYANRVCHLIDGGSPCPDVAVLYAAESVWAGGGDSNIPVCRSLAEAQVDYHILPADVFAENGPYPMQFENNVLTVNGVSYHALIVSGCRYLDASAAQFIEKAAGDGFPVIFAGRKPIGITAAENGENAAFEEHIKGCALMPAEQIGTYCKAAEQIIKQAIFLPENRLLTSYHYRLDNRDELLILNENPGSVYAGTVTAQATGIPVRYYPWENRTERVAYVSVNETTQNISLRLDPLELCVLVFLKDEAEYAALCGEKSPEKDALVQNIETFRVGRVESKAYLLQLQNAKAGLHPKKPVVQTAEQLTVNAPFTGMQAQFPDFSGYYLYETEVALTPNETYILELEQASEAAEVFLNGTRIGTKIQAPYTFVLPAALVQAKNTLRIEVATLAERKARVCKTWVNAMSAERPYSPTGLVGAVRIYSVK